MFVLILGHATDILCKFSAQKASGNLDSSEHIYLGGAHGVRAYPQGEGLLRKIFPAFSKTY